MWLFNSHLFIGKIIYILERSIWIRFCVYEKKGGGGYNYGNYKTTFRTL